MSVRWRDRSVNLNRQPLVPDKVARRQRLFGYRAVFSKGLKQQIRRWNRKQRIAQLWLDDRSHGEGVMEAALYWCQQRTGQSL